VGVREGVFGVREEEALEELKRGVLSIKLVVVGRSTTARPIHSRCMQAGGEFRMVVPARQTYAQPYAPCSSFWSLKSSSNWQ